MVSLFPSSLDRQETDFQLYVMMKAFFFLSSYVKYKQID